MFTTTNYSMNEPLSEANVQSTIHLFNSPNAHITSRYMQQLLESKLYENTCLYVYDSKLTSLHELAQVIFSRQSFLIDPLNAMKEYELSDYIESDSIDTMLISKVFEEITRIYQNVYFLDVQELLPHYTTKKTFFNQHFDYIVLDSPLGPEQLPLLKEFLIHACSYIYINCTGRIPQFEEVLEGSNTNPILTTLFSNDSSDLCALSVEGKFLHAPDNLFYDEIYFHPQFNVFEKTTL